MDDDRPPKTVWPSLTYRDAPAAIAFLVDVFGFEARLVVHLPQSFSESRMVDEFGPGTGPAWLWRARARHAARRVSVRVGRREH